jgi:hypothetical protein
MLRKFIDGMKDPGGSAMVSNRCRVSRHCFNRE